MSSDIASGVIHRLREVLAELEKDKKRMDFICSRYGNNWAYGQLDQSRAVARLEIDAAMAVKEQWEREEAEDYRRRMEGMSRG